MAAVMWDNDGVMSDWVGNFYPWLCKKMGWVQTEWEIWHHYRNHEMHDAEFVAALKEYAEEGGFAEQQIYSDVRTAIQKIKAHGDSQHVVTDRPEAAQADTAWWVDTYTPEIDTLSFSRDKTVFKEYDDGPYYALDDRVENVQAMIDAGIQAFLLDRPWNRNVDLPRVFSATEFAEVVTSST